MQTFKLKEGICRYAASLGISQDALVWTEKCDILEFVKRCGMPDLALDTHPINAHTVAMDYLWMGTPLLTMPGEGWASRVASSVLRASGVSWREFSSHTPNHKFSFTALVIDAPRLIRIMSFGFFLSLNARLMPSDPTLSQTLCRLIMRAVAISVSKG